MRRDWDLVRAILVSAEAKPPGEMLDSADVADSPPELVKAHISMLADAGFIRAHVLKGDGMGAGNVRAAMVTEITFAGFDLLETMRSKTLWASIKKMAGDRGLDLSFEVIKQLASIAIKAIVGTSD